MRAFLGTLLGDSNQALYRQVAGRLVTRHPDVLRRIPDTSAHLTYAFLAALDEARKDDVLSAVSAVTSRHRGVPIRLGPPRILSAGRTPRVICADVVRGADEIRRLADDLVAALRDTLTGVEVSPMKSAHVTLARLHRHASRSDAKAIAATLTDAEYARVVADEQIDRVQLVASTLTPRGSVYTIIGTRPLG